MNNISTWPFKVLIKYASRGRPKRFFDGMDNIYSMCSQPDHIRVLVTADWDDPLMCNEEVKERISGYKNSHVIYGKSENKIHAINRDMDLLPDEWKDWSIIANFSDDQRFTITGWDDILRVDFNQVSPDFSHFMAYLDPDTKGALSTLYIAGKGFYNKFGFIYDPKFKSLFCDNLVEDAAKRLGKFHYTGYSIYQHFNSSYGYADFPPDEMYLEQQRVGWSVDNELYYKIIGEGIDNYLLNFITNESTI